MRLDALRRQRDLAVRLFVWSLVTGAGAVGGLLAYAVIATRRPRQVPAFFGGPPGPPDPAPLPSDDPALMGLIVVSLMLGALGLLLRLRLRRTLHALRASLGGHQTRP
jgi:hypothetical protein